MNRNFNTFSSQSDNYKEAQTCELDKMPEEQAKAMMGEMGKLLKNLGEQGTLEEYYNRHYAEKSKNSFKGTTAQIKQLFSLLFIKNRDSETIKSDNLLEISLKNGGNLYVRDKNEKEFTTVSSGDIVKSLGETKKMRGLTYIKIEYTNSSGKKIEGYVSKNCVKKTTDELNNLNGYIRNLGTNPSRHVKENIFKNIDPIGRYRGTLDQNAMIYHYLVQKYEFNKFLKSSLKKEKTQKKANLLKQEITPVKTPVSSTQEQADSPSTNIPSANIAASVSAYERNENRTGLDSKNTAVITTIEAEDNKADKNNPNVRTASLGRIPIPISVIERMRRKLNKIEKEINAEADITGVESTADDTTSSEEIIPEPISDNSTPAEAHLEQQNDTPPQAVASIKNASPIPPKLSVEEEVSDIDKTSGQETTAVDTTETDKKPEISTEKTIKEQLEIRQELNKILTVKVLEIENKISSNEKIQAYLNKKYGGDFDKFLNNVFGVKSIYETDITLMAKAFGYLHINANNIFLYQYRKELNITEDKKDELCEKYYDCNIFSEYPNLKLFYSLVIENELGEEFINLIKETNTIDIKNINGLDPNKVEGVPAETGGTDNGPMCSLTAWKNADRLGVHIERNHSWKLIAKLKKQNEGIEASTSDLKEKLYDVLTTNNCNFFEIYPETDNGHRADAILGNDGNFYILDPYYGTKNRRPQLLEERLADVKGHCTKILIGKTHIAKI